MTSSTHKVFGITLALFIMNLTKEVFYFPLLITFYASTLPDIDHPAKKNLISKFISKVFGHRKITHSILGLFIAWVLFIILNVYLLMPVRWINFFTTGYVSHLIMDSLTKHGIPLLYPLPYRFKVPIFTTGKRKELIFRKLMIAVMIYLLCRTFLIWMQII